MHPRGRLLAVLVLVSACAAAGSEPTAASADPNAALDTAARYVLAVCAVDWRTPYDAWRQMATSYLSPHAAGEFPAPAIDRAGWDQSVVASRTTSSCTILDNRIQREAPNTAARCYIRIVVRRTISSDGHIPATDEPEYGLVMVQHDQRWLVDAQSYGG